MPTCSLKQIIKVNSITDKSFKNKQTLTNKRSAIKVKSNVKNKMIF